MEINNNSNNNRWVLWIVLCGCCVYLTIRALIIHPKENWVGFYQRCFKICRSNTTTWSPSHHFGNQGVCQKLKELLWVIYKGRDHSGTDGAWWFLWPLPQLCLIVAWSYWFRADRSAAWCHRTGLRQHTSGFGAGAQGCHLSPVELQTPPIKPILCVQCLSCCSGFLPHR